jgi:lactose/L-arabinose transport system ATP-binding protein
MNLLDAVWQGAGRVAAGGQAVQSGLAGSALVSGAKVKLGIRPEHLTVSTTGTDGLEATVDFAEYLGGTQYLYCQLPDGQPVTVEYRSAAEINTGGRIFLSAAPADIRLFDEGGLAVA